MGLFDPPPILKFIVKDKFSYIKGYSHAGGSEIFCFVTDKEIVNLDTSSMMSLKECSENIYTWKRCKIGDTIEYNPVTRRFKIVSDNQ